MVDTSMSQPRVNQIFDLRSHGGSFFREGTGQPDFRSDRLLDGGAEVEIKTTDLGHNTYMLEGQGGNITVG